MSRKPQNELCPLYERRQYKRRCPERHQLNERRRQAIMLRMAGATNIEIGLRLHADPSVNSTGEAYVGGYGWKNWIEQKSPVLGKVLGDSVSRDIRGELDRGEETLAESRDMYRNLEVDRLDFAQKAIWARVAAGNDWAIDRFLGIVDRRIKILGLDAPMKIETKVDQNITIQQGALPEVNQDFANAVLDGIAELASAPAQGGPAEITEGGDDVILEADIVEGEIVE